MIASDIHGSEDRWVVRQMARLMLDVGATPFIDIFNIKSGERFEEKIHEAISETHELVALLTPWSIRRNWIWSEISAAWILKKHYVGVLYGVTIKEIENRHGGMATLAATKVVAINEFDDYISGLSGRVGARSLP